MAEADIPKKRKITEEIDALRVYINELLSKVYDRLKLSVPQYTSNWSTTYPFSPTAKRQEKAKEALKKAKEDLKKVEEQRAETSRQHVNLIVDTVHNILDG